MPDYVFNNATDTNLRDINGANITGTAIAHGVLGTIGTNATLEYVGPVTITQGETTVTTVGTATRILLSMIDSHGLYEAP